ITQIGTGCHRRPYERPAVSHRKYCWEAIQWPRDERLAIRTGRRKPLDSEKFLSGISLNGRRLASSDFQGSQQRLRTVADVFVQELYYPEGATRAVSDPA